MTDYATLQTRIAQRAHRSSLTALVPSFIQTAEQMINRKVRVMEMQQSGTLTVPAAGSVALPDRFLGFRHVALSIAAGLGNTAECNYMPPDQFHEKRINSTIFSGSTRDAFYTIEGGNVLLLPTPASGNTSVLDVSYWQGFPTLDGVTNTTNWLLTNHFNIYLWAALADLYDHTQDVAAEAKYMGKFEYDVNELHRSERRKARSGPHVRRPGGVTP